ncbi:MAG: glycosyltransferase [Verrucomicrobiota bacterium]|nr:glycosyltransferase [Verrucomicrobiota bacterium]
MLPTPAHPLRADLARRLTQKFGCVGLVIVGSDDKELAAQFVQLNAEVTVCRSSKTLRQNGQRPRARVIVWIYPKHAGDDAAEVEGIAQIADEVVLLPELGAEVTKRRPRLVESFQQIGFAPRYDVDLSDLGSAALQLTRSSGENEHAAILSVETAFARLNQRLEGMERTLRTRMSELEAADRHIAKLEEKVLGLKEAKRAVKQLKAEKQALRKSPERRIGQVLLAPYRLPQKLYRAINQRGQRPATGAPHASAVSARKYQAWLARHRATPEELEGMRKEAATFTNAPLISILTPVFNTPPAWLAAAVDSVRAQVYENWELILIDDASTDESTLNLLQSLTTPDRRIRCTRREQTGGISAASNTGLAMAAGEWIGLLDHDDFLEPDALFRVAQLLQAHPDADVIYSDEDKLTEEGFDAPLFKPDWSPDFFLSYNYICHFATLRRTLVDEVGGFRSDFDGAQDYDLLLRVIENTRRIHHIPRVLYHWRRSASSTSDNIRRKPKALEAGKNAINEHLQRAGEAAHVVVDWRTHAYCVRRELLHDRRISIIIPVRDGIPLLSRCIDSLVKATSYHDYEIVIVNNDSASEEARRYFAGTPHRVLNFPGPFNFSAINNFAVAQTDSPWLLFLNNDVEVIESEWLSAMAEHIQRPAVGAVGARLLYPNDTVQHAGIVVGVGGIAEDAFRGFGAEDPGVCRQLQVIRNYSAVTGACLMTRREVFDEVGGFDEERLPVTFNDVDLCLKMRRAGYQIVYTPFAKLYHHESATRRPSVEARETEVMRERWADALARDPYYNPNLSRVHADFSLGE